MLIMKMSVLGMKEYQQWGAIEVKKKLLAIALGTSVVFALGACGNKEESKPSNQSASTDSAEQIFQKKLCWVSRNRFIRSNWT